MEKYNEKKYFESLGDNFNEKREDIATIHEFYFEYLEFSTSSNPFGILRTIQQILEVIQKTTVCTLDGGKELGVKPMSVALTRKDEESPAELQLNDIKEDFKGYSEVEFFKDIRKITGCVSNKKAMLMYEMILNIINSTGVIDYYDSITQPWLTNYGYEVLDVLKDMTDFELHHLDKIETSFELEESRITREKILNDYENKDFKNTMEAYERLKADTEISKELTGEKSNPKVKEDILSKIKKLLRK